MAGNELKFKIEFPTDKGFFGRECNNPDCGRYFRVHEESLLEEMYCPYCAEKFHKNDLFTSEQKKYAEDFAREKAKEYAQKELDKIFQGIARKSKFITYKPSPKHARQVKPSYKEKETDSELTCPTCKCKFQVYGIFGHCPGCKKENILIYDANAELILEDIKRAHNKNRALRHAYSDIVSAFEIFCKQQASRITTETTRFQNIYDTRRFYKKHLDIDILEKLTHVEELTFKRIFYKRHIYGHNDGVISENYVKDIPEDTNKLGDKAELSVDEFILGTKVIRKVLSTIINKLN